MKKFAALCLLLVISLPADALENGQVMYTGGTVPALQAGVLGHLDTTSQTALSFEYGGNNLVIPYAKIDSFEHSAPVARHLGILPVIVVTLFRVRQRKHFIQISYRDETNSTQVAIFEVSKHAPRALFAVLQTRSPQGCKPPYITGCLQRNCSQCP
jgi:hypothetical protein